MPRSQHLIGTPVVVSYGAHRHAGHGGDVPSSSLSSSGTASATIATRGQRRVWTWKPVPDTAGRLDQT